MQAIVINYITCFIMGSIFMGKFAINVDTLHQAWLPYALFLSLLFIIFFNVGAFAIQKIGLTIISIFQKLSLIFPVSLGILFFGEPGHFTRLLAIFLAIIAIVLLNLPDKKIKTKDDVLRQYWYLPFLVLLGNGTIEITLFFVEEKNLVSGMGLAFVSALFGLSGLWGLIMLVVQKELNFNRADIIGGILLGIPNFFTIYLLLKALEIGWDGSVLFPLNNVGTLALTALVGLFLFKEKLSRYNYWGMFIAIIAVILISY